MNNWVGVKRTNEDKCGKGNGDVKGGYFWGLAEGIFGLVWQGSCVTVGRR